MERPPATMLLAVLVLAALLGGGIALALQSMTSLPLAATALIAAPAGPAVGLLARRIWTHRAPHNVL